MTSAAEPFEPFWESPADVLGTATSATVLRCPIQRAASRIPSAELVIVVGSRMPLVALRAYGEEQDRWRSGEAGFDAHLVKPVSYEDLTRLLGRGGS